MRNIPSTDLAVHPLCLGGNVFGWTADEAESFAVLDAYAAAGGNFVDTADGYSQWVPGHRGGESEEIVGRWMAARGNRDAIVARHQGRLEGRPQGARGRQRAHRDRGVAAAPADRPHRPALHPSRRRGDGARGDARRARRARRARARSATSPPRTSRPSAWRRRWHASAREGLVRYVALQPHYNLVERDYENGLADVCRRHDLGCLPYFALAMGFLTGKYRAGRRRVESQRARGRRRLPRRARRARARRPRRGRPARTTSPSRP